MNTLTWLITGGFAKGHRTQILGVTAALSTIGLLAVGEMSLPDLIATLPIARDLEVQRGMQLQHDERRPELRHSLTHFDQPPTQLRVVAPFQIQIEDKKRPYHSKSHQDLLL